MVTRYRMQRDRGDYPADGHAALRSMPPAWRECLVEWLQLIVIKKPFLHADTVACAVSLLDSYIWKCPAQDVPNNTADYQLCGVAAFILATKFYERNAVAQRTTHDFCRGRFPAASIAAMEHRITAVLDWHMCPITTYELARQLLDHASHYLHSGTAPSEGDDDDDDDRDEDAVAEATREEGIKRLEGITTVFLDLQLSTTRELEHPRPAVALGLLQAACQICHIVPQSALLPLIGADLFTEEELGLVDGISNRCHATFFSTFPDISCRAPSPQSVMDLPAGPAGAGASAGVLV